MSRRGLAVEFRDTRQAQLSLSDRAHEPTIFFFAKRLLLNQTHRAIGISFATRSSINRHEEITDGNSPNDSRHQRPRTGTGDPAAGRHRVIRGGLGDLTLELPREPFSHSRAASTEGRNTGFNSSPH